MLRHSFLAAAAVAGSIAAAVPTVAQGSSLVFVKGGQIWISGSDGSGARPVTATANNWAWPSEADDGTIFAAGGAARVNPGGTDSDGSSEIYHLNQAGGQIGAPVTTPGSSSSPACPTYAPTSLRVSPDGRRAVYDAFSCDYGYPFLHDLGSGQFSSFATDYAHPQWLDNTHVLISHIGPTVGNAAFAVYDTVSRTGHGPSDDPYLTDRQATASRDGSRVAVLEDDGPDYLDGAHHADIRLYATTGNDVTLPVLKCTLTIDPASIGNFTIASPAFAPDGSRLVWGANDGVHSADTASLDNCGAIADRLLIAGAAYPFFGTAAVADLPPAGGGPGSGPAPTPTPPGPPPPAPQRPVTFTITSSTKTARLTGAGALRLVLTAAETGTGRVTGTLALPKTARVVRFAPAAIRLRAGRRAAVTLRLSRRDGRLARAALRRTRKLRASVTVSARSAAGHSAVRRFTIAVSR